MPLPAKLVNLVLTAAQVDRIAAEIRDAATLCDLRGAELLGEPVARLQALARWGHRHHRRGGAAGGRPGPLTAGARAAGRPDSRSSAELHGARARGGLGAPRQGRARLLMTTAACRQVVLDISPAVADRILRGNRHNRPIRPDLVAALVAAMTAGTWHSDGVTVKIRADGTLIDGQHRLLAVVESGTTQRMPVTFGLPGSTTGDGNA